MIHVYVSSTGTGSHPKELPSSVSRPEMPVKSECAHMSSTKTVAKEPGDHFS